jgi:hypothetical protein
MVLADCLGNCFYPKNDILEVSMYPQVYELLKKIEYDEMLNASSQPAIGIESSDKGR